MTSRWRRRDVQGAPDARMLHALVAAFTAADAAAVRAALHPDVTVTVDGGGAVPVPISPLRGRVAAVGALCEAVAGGCPTVASINGTPGITVHDGDRCVAALTAAVRDDALIEVWVVRAPDKLAHWNRG